MTSEKAGFSSQRLDRIMSAINRSVGVDKVAGSVSLLARRGDIVHHASSGFQNRETETPMALDSIFRIYSMTKPVTIVAAMMLYEEGLFRLSDPLAQYLPEFANMQVYQGGEGGSLQLEPLAVPITIHHLFTHTAGLSYHFLEYGQVEQMYREAQIFTRTPLAEFSENVARLPLAFQPGTQFRYSVGHDILARLVEVLSGQTFGRFLNERIFKPLGMVDTDFYVPQEKHHRFTSMYGSVTIDLPNTSITEWFGLAFAGQNNLLDGVDDSFYAAPHQAFRGGSGLVSTAYDYWLFCQMLLNKGELNGQRLLGRKTIELMTCNHLRPDQLPVEVGGVPSPGYGFGLGMRVMMDIGQAGILGSTGEYGWGGAASTYFWIDPVEEMIGVFMSQFQPSSFHPTPDHFRIAAYQALID